MAGDHGQYDRGEFCVHIDEDESLSRARILQFHSCHAKAMELSWSITSHFFSDLMQRTAVLPYVVIHQPCHLEANYRPILDSHHHQTDDGPLASVSRYYRAYICSQNSAAFDALMPLPCNTSLTGLRDGQLFLLSFGGTDGVDGFMVELS